MPCLRPCSLAGAGSRQGGYSSRQKAGQPPPLPPRHRRSRPKVGGYRWPGLPVAASTTSVSISNVSSSADCSGKEYRTEVALKNSGFVVTVSKVSPLDDCSGNKWG